MSNYRPISQVSKRITAALTALDLAPTEHLFTPEAAIKRYARYYMTTVESPRHRVFWFKASLQNDYRLRRALREEVGVQKMFAEYEKRRRPSFDSPSYVTSHDDRRGFVWLVRKYWTGMYAGDMTDAFGFSPAFFRGVTPAMMSRILSDVRGMTGFVRQRATLESHDLGWYMLDFNYYRREFFLPMIRQSPNLGWTRRRVDQLEELLLAHRGFFRTHATSFTHGDMYPTNIMIRSGQRRPVVLFDWELSHLNLPTFDSVMIYLHAWRKPAWQADFRRRVLTSLGQPATADTCWRLATASLATRLAGFCYIRLHQLQPDRYSRLTQAQRPILEKMFRKFMAELEWAMEGPNR